MKTFLGASMESSLVSDSICPVNTRKIKSRRSVPGAETKSHEHLFYNLKFGFKISFISNISENTQNLITNIQEHQTLGIKVHLTLKKVETHVGP